MTWSWEDFAPHYDALKSTDLSAENLEGWLGDWSKVSAVLSEIHSRLHVAPTLNTADKAAVEQLQSFSKNIHEPQQAAEEDLRKKLLASGLTLKGMEVPIRQMRANSELFREENLPLQTQLVELSSKHDEICGARSVEWDGKEITLEQVSKFLEEPDTGRREKAWRLKHGRILQDRQKMNDLWTEMFDIRSQIAKNADCKNLVDYVAQDYHRFDYTPQDCEDFRNSIAEHVVPAATAIYKERAARQGAATLKPWDEDFDVWGDEPLQPFETEAEMLDPSAEIFERLDPVLAERYQDMRDRGLMDLFSRKNKAGGGYCTSYAVEQRPFIFMNAVGTQDNLQTLIHEMGHAFHVYETAALPYDSQKHTGAEFAEVASMSMEMLAQAHLGVYYDEKSAARAQISHLERMICFWPYMAVVDGFQHWAYANPQQGRIPAECDKKWTELWRRFMPGIDYAGLEDLEATGWHRKLHIFLIPFYYVEYGLAQVGALQVWQNSLKDEADAVAKYRHGLSLGCTVGLPQLFEAVGGKFAFDGETISSLSNQMVERLAELKAQLNQPGGQVSFRPPNR
jgi:oligoendopeptidase F